MQMSDRFGKTRKRGKNKGDACFLTSQTSLWDRFLKPKIKTSTETKTQDKLTWYK